MKGRFILMLLPAWGIAALAFGQNPICPPGLNIADPTARVWADGKLYVYGSRDDNLRKYCSHDHWVLSTSDLLHWEYVPNVFASIGPDDKVPYNEERLYAPDCMFRNGTYYLYYCQPGKGREGVATSHNPTGPFSVGIPMNVAPFDEIDPAAFIDDDGQAYYLWGQFQAKIAKLKPDMMAIEPSTINPNLLNVKQHEFHEGGFMAKRNGIYYFVYASTERNKRPTCISYATSASPTGPFTHRGVIIDNAGCDPKVWNNHGSIAEFQGRWYVFYHRATNGTNKGRKACIEPIEFLPDGSIPEVEMTSQGAGPPLDAFAAIEAERACLLGGNVRIEYDANDRNNPVSRMNNDRLGQISDGDWAAFKYIDFGKGARKISVRVKSGTAPARVDVHLDALDGPCVGHLDMPAGAGDWTMVDGRISSVAGIHAVYLRFSLPGNAEGLYAVDRLVFE